MIHDIPETRVHIVGSKCRVYPNAHQKKRMDSIFGKTRYVRNELISMNRSQEKPYKPITYGL
ncbi:MAG: helix-turn-helix domain-containing protein, partial [Bacilli bacterium]